jgi:hypothetical protein
VFLDIATIEPGIDFVDHIRQAVEASDVILVIIGPRWIDRDYDGRSRLENPDDFIRMEIASALQSRKRLIPVLVGGAGMPRASELPPELAKLTHYQAIELSDTDWENDLERLSQALGMAGLAESPRTSLELPAAGRGIWSKIAALGKAIFAPAQPAEVRHEQAAPQARVEHAIFISHAKEDRALVERVVTALEETRLRCWVSYRDIPAGESSWAGAIAGAIATSRIVVIVVSRHAMASKQVLREVTIADNENIPFIPFCIDEEPLTNDFKYFFSTAQRLDAGKMSRSEALTMLSMTVRKHPAAIGLNAA